MYSKRSLWQFVAVAFVILFTSCQQNTEDIPTPLAESPSIDLSKDLNLDDFTRGEKVYSYKAGDGNFEEFLKEHGLSDFNNDNERSSCSSNSPNVSIVYYSDRSNTIHVQVVSMSYTGQNICGTSQVSNSYILVGGGAWANPNALLTSSYPVRTSHINTDKRKWQASSKDHQYPSNHQLNVYAVGLKIDGVSTLQLYQNVEYFSAGSTASNRPSASVGINTNYALIGGGTELNQVSGAECLLTKSAPLSQYGWSGAGKDHIYGGTSTANVRAIGINKSFLNSKGIEVLYNWNSVYSANGAGYAGVYPASGSVLVGVGAEANYSGAGRLLTHISPWGNYAFAKSKDHGYASSGTTYIHVWSLRR